MEFYLGLQDNELSRKKIHWVFAIIFCLINILFCTEYFLSNIQHQGSPSERLPDYVIQAGMFIRADSIQHPL